ncbi:hypothetical protein EV421DRAFT_1744543 [Armillaria borealis]|uniref:Uncharacterized protein n=1 Tax=Armillaria borealis TaxID=47425 RepID=A0AA39IUM0_9AGAR|nr:hypothetical protein EV421DRAFT_1744543 [Armillaria borealis]
MPNMLPILDIIHRGVVYSLVGLTIYAGVGIVSTHNNTMRAGRDTDGPVSEALARHEEDMRKQSLVPDTSTSIGLLMGNEFIQNLRFWILGMYGCVNRHSEDDGSRPEPKGSTSQPPRIAGTSWDAKITERKYSVPLVGSACQCNNYY